MLILGIETSTPLTSVALAGPDGLLASRALARGRGHVEFLMPTITDLCRDAGVTTASLTGIAVGIGPGLFTSMRVGIATAKTMAQMLALPLVGVASLDQLAFTARHTSRLICACVYARRGEVYAAWYRAVPGGVQRESDYGVWTPEALVAEVTARGEEALLVGDGAMAYEHVFTDPATEIDRAIRSPRADALLQLAMPRFEREETTSVAHLEPLYVRRSDAEINWEKRGVTIDRPLHAQGPKGAR